MNEETALCSKTYKLVAPNTSYKVE